MESVGKIALRIDIITRRISAEKDSERLGEILFDGIPL